MPNCASGATSVNPMVKYGSTVRALRVFGLFGSRLAMVIASRSCSGSRALPAVRRLVMWISVNYEPLKLPLRVIFELMA